MARYLFINSRDSYEYANSENLFQLAEQLRKRGNEVTLFLVENGVLAARNGSVGGKRFGSLKQQGLRVLAEDISLKARGIDRPADGVDVSNMDELAELIVTGSDKVMWY